MDGERARRKVSERVAGRSGRIGGERFAGGHAQAQPARLFPLPVSSHSRLDSQPRHLVWLKEGSRSEGAGEDIDAARQRERMRQAHPVKCAVDDALRRVDVIVPVDVEQPRRAGTHAAERGDDSQRDRAVPAQHEHHVAVRQQGPEQAAENLRGFFPGEAAGVPVVDGRHQIVVENIDVEVHPEPLGTWTGDRGYCFSQGARSAAFADFRAVNDRDGRVANVLVENVVVVAEHAVPDQRDVLVPDEWPQPVQVSEDLRAASGHQGEVERRDLAVRLVVGVLKVGVAVDEDKAVTAAAPQCEHRPEHDAAVTAEHDRETVAVERCIHRSGKAPCDRRDPLRIQDPCLRIADIAVRRYLNARFIRRAEARMQACRPQRAGSGFHAVRPEAKRRRHLDDEGFHRCHPAQSWSVPSVGAPAKGSICLVACRTSAPRSRGERWLCIGPVPSLRSTLAIAAPRAAIGSAPVRTASISCTSRSAAAIRSRHSGPRGVRGTGGRRPRSRTCSQPWASPRRPAGETICRARMASARLDPGGHPARSWRSRDGARTRASKRFHGWWSPEADRSLSVFISLSCPSTRAPVSGRIDIMRNDPANLGLAGRKDRAASSRAIGPGRDAHAVAIVIDDGVAAFELGVACDVFGDEWAAMFGVPWYRSFVCGITPGPVTTDSGFQILPAHGLDRIRSAGTVIVLPTVSFKQVPAEMLDVLRQAHARGSRIVSLCTGAYALAGAGLLDGRRATTHWTECDELARLHPKVTVDPGVLFVDEGDILTSAGSAASIDLCLHVVRQDYGTEIATQLARQLVVQPQRDGGQAQYIDAPMPELDSASLFAGTVRWLQEHLDEPITVEDQIG